MDALEDIKTDLHNLNYPGINTMSDEAIAKVFGCSNRLNFLTWVYEQLEADSPLPGQPPGKCIALTEILYENGLCSSSEKVPFVTGDEAFDPLQQLQICQRIFNLLRAMKRKRENAAVSKPGISLDDLDSFLNQDMNLFPEFGIMKTRSSGERKEAINNYKKEMQSLQEEIKSLELTDGLNVNYYTSQKKYDGTILSDLENETIKLKENIESLTGVGENDNNQFIADGLELSSTECNEALGTLVQYFDNIEVMNKFEDNLSTPVSKNTDNSKEKVIEELCKLSGEVVSEFENVP